MNLFTKLVISLITAGLAAVAISQLHLSSTLHLWLMIAAATVGTTFLSQIKRTAPASTPTAKPQQKKQNNAKKEPKAAPKKAAPKQAAPATPSGPREEGEVKWFNVSKGFGFVVRENGEEIFVHFRSIRGDANDRRSLKDGQRVAFTLAESDKGPQAEDVEPL
jgi:CspA family cold shock protein